jgi:hypothetical protein
MGSELDNIGIMRLLVDSATTVTTRSPCANIQITIDTTLI